MLSLDSARDGGVDHRRHQRSRNRTRQQQDEDDRCQYPGHHGDDERLENSGGKQRPPETDPIPDPDAPGAERGGDEKRECHMDPTDQRRGLLTPLVGLE